MNDMSPCVCMYACVFVCVFNIMFVFVDVYSIMDFVITMINDK
jgi:hypothetical protein